MYGLIVRLTSASGRRTELIDVLGGDDSHTVAGCLSFIVSEDQTDEDVLWVTEVWDSEASHKASLSRSPSRPRPAPDRNTGRSARDSRRNENG